MKVTPGFIYYWFTYFVIENCRGEPRDVFSSKVSGSSILGVCVCLHTCLYVCLCVFACVRVCGEIYAYLPALCISSFGTLPYLDPEGIQPKTDGTAEIYAPFYLYMQKLNF